MMVILQNSILSNQNYMNPFNIQIKVKYPSQLTPNNAIVDQYQIYHTKVTFLINHRIKDSKLQIAMKSNIKIKIFKITKK